MGAGLAGLTAARELVKRGIKSVVVLEARDRVGGRTLNESIGGGHVVEAGGEFAGPRHTAVLALAGELGIKTFPTYFDGKTVYFLGGQRSLVEGDRIGEGDLLTSPDTFRKMLEQVPLEKPWENTKAREYDAQTVASWLAGNVKSPEAKTLITIGINQIFYADPAELSLLYFLLLVHSAGGLLPLFATRAGAQDRRFVGGSQLISLKIAGELGRNLVLNSPVTKISNWERGPVRIESANASVEARHVIVAMMPADNARIEFDPPLPSNRRKLVRRWPAGHILKANVVYDEPFWRKDGLNGQALGDAGPVETTFDNSPPEGSPGVILVFTNPKASFPSSPGERRDLIAGELAKLFGERARKPIGYVELDWGMERWTMGCVSPLGPGLLTTCGAALRAPVGRIHWAGTESSLVWSGYMDGAVRSGKRSAEEVAVIL